MEVRLVQTGKRDVLQKDGIACIDGDQRVAARCRRMGERSRRICEDTVPELKHVARRGEVGHDILAEVGPEN